MIKEIVKKRQDELVEWMDLVFRSGTVFKRSLKEVVNEEVLLPFWAVCFRIESNNPDEVRMQLQSSSERELLEMLTEGLLDFVIQKLDVEKVLEEKVLTDDEVVSIVKGWMLAVLVIFLEVYSLILGACLWQSSEDIFQKTREMMIRDFLSIQKH
ncbi:MAG: hypothetical protein QXT86_13720 [Archaeoglobaceae archaeon]